MKSQSNLWHIKAIEDFCHVLMKAHMAVWGTSFKMPNIDRGGYTALRMTFGKWNISPSWKLSVGSFCRCNPSRWTCVLIVLCHLARFAVFCFLLSFLLWIFLHHTYCILSIFNCAHKAAPFIYLSVNMLFCILWHCSANIT